MITTDPEVMRAVHAWTFSEPAAAPSCCRGHYRGKAAEPRSSHLARLRRTDRTAQTASISATRSGRCCHSAGADRLSAAAVRRPRINSKQSTTRWAILRRPSCCARSPAGCARCCAGGFRGAVRRRRFVVSSRTSNPTRTRRHCPAHRRPAQRALQDPTIIGRDRRPAPASP